jgi:hypothetical protein
MLCIMLPCRKCKRQTMVALEKKMAKTTLCSDCEPKPMIVKSHGHILKSHLLYGKCSHRSGSRHYTDIITDTNCLDCLWDRAYNKTLTRGERRYAQTRAQAVQNGFD